MLVMNFFFGPTFTLKILNSISPHAFMSTLTIFYVALHMLSRYLHSRSPGFFEMEGALLKLRRGYWVTDNVRLYIYRSKA